MGKTEQKKHNSGRQTRNTVEQAPSRLYIVSRLQPGALEVRLGDVILIWSKVISL